MSVSKLKAMQTLFLYLVFLMKLFAEIFYVHVKNIAISHVDPFFAVLRQLLLLKQLPLTKHLQHTPPVRLRVYRCINRVTQLLLKAG